MAKYCFKVYLTDNNIKTIVPMALNNNMDLSDMDKFVYECGSEFDLIKKLAEELKIEAKEISRVKIIQQKKEIEYSLLTTNPYLKSAVTSVNKKRISNYRNYEFDEIVVSKDNSTYLDMKKFLFENLESNYNFFLKEIYTYTNEFARLLYRYGDICNQVLHSEEDLRNLEELRNKIITGLTIYKNFRGLCKSRYEYERKSNYYKKRKPIIKDSHVYKKTKEFNEERHPQLPTYEFNQYTNDLGEEREEFLDSNEIDQAYEYGKRR